MKPIIFSTPMVQAIQDGRKTQTRRVIKGDILPGWDQKWQCPSYLKIKDDKPYGRVVVCPYPPGTVLWVRETWQEGYNPDNIDKNGEIPLGYCYKASDHDISAEFSLGKWRSPRFMPKAAARIFLLVKNVRIERLQDITEEDAIAEGVYPCYEKHLHCDGREYRCSFEQLWDSLNAKRGHPYTYSSNPWGWVIEFKRISSGVT